MSRHGGYISPLKQEKLETGFKALNDGKVVKRILDEWVDKQSQHTRAQDDRFVNPPNGDTGSNEQARGEKPNIGTAAIYISPVYGFSIKFPDSWEITSRYRRLAFGKWGLEREAVWSVPDAKPKWNVIRGQNESNTLTMGFQIGGHNRLSRGQIGIDLQRRIGALGPRRKEHIRRGQLFRHWGSSRP